jgi:hypothetical protein
MLPRIARVRVEAARDRVVVDEDVELPRGEWQSGGFDVFAAFGAPGTPIAIDARLLSSPSAGAASAEEPGEALGTEPAVRGERSAPVQIGSLHMAGFLVHLKDAPLRRAYERGDVATLRLRSLLSPPISGSDGARDVVVRLGAAEGNPLTLGRVEVRTLDPRARVTRAEATLCGPGADDWPLAVDVAPTAGRASPRPGRGPIAPELAVRHASDDLCVRWWVGP